MENTLIQGKAKDYCSKCKNGTCYLKDSDTYICTDPYDNEERAIGAQTDIECTMFEPKTTSPSEGSRIEELIKASKRKDELIQNYREKLKKENEAGSKIVEENVKLENEMKRLKEANENLLEKCKVYIDENTDLKLKVENFQSNINFQKYLKDEAYKREDKLKKELNKVKAHDEALTKHFQNDEKLIDNIQKVIFPQEEGSDYAYSYDEILNKVKELKVQCEEDKTMDKVMYEDLEYWKERCHKAETDVTTLNSKVEVLDKRNTNQFVMIGEKDKKINTLLNTNKGLTDKIGSLKNKIVNQQSTHYKQCARILELENMVSKLQSGEYDDILAKDIEIKSLQAKYEDAMAGWKDSMDTNDKLNQTISDLTESNEKLKKMVERRDKWIDDLRSDVDTLQNEVLTIRDIAQKAYDDTNRD